MVELEQHEKFLGLCRREKIRDIVLGGQLHAMKQFGAYRMATGINTWEEYLEQPEVNISKHRASKLISIYVYFAELLKFTPERLQDVPTYALDYIRKAGLVDIGVIESLFDDARILSRKDFKEKFQDDVVSVERTYTYLLMKKANETGAMTKVHDVPLSELFEIAKKYDPNYAR